MRLECWVIMEEVPYAPQCFVVRTFTLLLKLNLVVRSVTSFSFMAFLSLLFPLVSLFCHYFFYLVTCYLLNTCTFSYFSLPAFFAFVPLS